MPRPLLTIRSSLAAVAVPGHYGAPASTGVTLTELTGMALALVAARGGQIAPLSEAIEREFGTGLPLHPGRTARDRVAFIWCGCDQWLAMDAAADDFVRRLASSAGPLASITDLTGSRTILRLAGQRARDVLMKIVPIDLDESAFVPGDAALTIAARIPVELWQIDSAPTYEICSPRSYGLSLWQALIAAVAEYGCDVG